MEREFTVRPVLSKKDNPEISMSVIELKGVNRYVFNVENTSVYMCTKGKVTFMINRDGTFLTRVLTPGQSIKIPPKTPYLDFSEKGATLIAINKAAFDSEQVIELPLPEKLIQFLRMVNPY